MLRKKGVLFVDDDSNVLEGLRHILYSRNNVWDMNFADSVDKAIEILNGNNIEAVVSDIHMPGKDGFKLLSAIRNNKQTQDIPVVMLTGVNENGIKKQALDLGATDLLNKPADPDELVARINNMLCLKTYQDEIKAHNEILEREVKERTAEVEDARIDLIWRLAKAGEYRDSDTGNHVVRVGYFSQVLAEALGMEYKFSEMIFLTAPLHDIGKIGIPDSILLKPGKLDTDEWGIMREHCKIGADILQKETIFQKKILNFDALHSAQDSINNDNPFLEMAASISLNHHEWWNGKGYPKGLVGKEIPIEARIVALSDVYDALFSKRPYKPEFPEEKAMSIMRSNNGTQFDPEIFDIFEKSLDVFADVRTHLADDDG